jgi:hypothetical protein
MRAALPESKAMLRPVSLAKAVWILAAVAVLTFHLWTVSFTTARDSHIVLAWAMIVLTFPLGMLTLFAYGFLAMVNNGSANDVVAWLLMASVGYFQWFWLIPRVLRLIARIFRGSKLRILVNRRH